MQPFAKSEDIPTAPALNSSKDRPRILAADDQQHVLEAIELLLRPQGYEVETARSPALVREALATGSYDSVLIDLNYSRDTTSGREGLDLLKPYRVVLTGCHPEYDSLAMLDTLEAYLRRGGRLMYMGGNGFYWRIAHHPTRAGVIEVRRAEGGVRAWDAEPGESHHSFTGEYGGLWRRNARAPQRLAGIGFISQGFDHCSYYRRTEAAANSRVAFAVAGIDDELIGNFGILQGGAAGLEIDAIDPLVISALVGPLAGPPDAGAVRTRSAVACPVSRLDGRHRARRPGTFLLAQRYGA